MATLVWQALISEGSGTTFGDNGPATKVPLTLGVSTQWNSNTGGVGWNFNNVAANKAASATLGSSKFQTAFAGVQQISCELLVNLSAFVASNTALYLGNTGFSGQVIQVTTNPAGTGYIGVSAADGFYFFPAVTGLHLWRIEVDSTAAVTLRIKCWIDGVAITAGVIVSSEVTANTALDFQCSTWSTNGLVLGSDGNTDTFSGSQFYAAIYSGTGVTDHTAALLANNDADPNGGGAAAQVPFRRDRVAASQSDPPDQGAQWARRRPISTVESLGWLPVGAMARLRDFLVSQSDPPTYSVPPADHIIQPGAAPATQVPYRGLVDRFLAWADPDQPWQRYARLVQPATGAQVATLVWQALIKEGSGTTFGDTGPATAVPLTVASTQWTGSSPHIGYNFAGLAVNKATSATLGSSKFQTAFAGAQQISCELRVNLAANFTSIFSGTALYLGATSLSGQVLEVQTNSAGTGYVGVAAGDGYYFFPCTSGVHLVRIEVDSTAAVTLRIKCWVDGTAVTVGVIVSIEVTANIALDNACSTWSGNALLLGNDGSSDTFNDPILYAALYSGTGVADHTAALASTDDADPNSGGGAAQVPFTRDHVAAPQSDPPDQGSQWARRRPISTVEALGWRPIGAMVRLRELLVSLSDPQPFAPPDETLYLPRRRPIATAESRAWKPTRVVGLLASLVDAWTAPVEFQQRRQVNAATIPAAPAASFVPFSRREQLREMLAEPVFYWMGMRSASIQGQVSADAPPPRGIGGSPVSQWTDPDQPWQRYARLVQGAIVNNAPGTLLRVIGAAIVRQWEAPDPDPQRARPSAVIQPPPPIVNAPIPFSRRWYDAVRAWDPPDPEPVQRRRAVTPSGAAPPAKLPYIARAIVAAIVDSWPRVDFEMPWPFSRRSAPRPGFVPTGAKIRPPLTVRVGAVELTVRVGDVTLSVLGDI